MAADSERPARQHSETREAKKKRMKALLFLLLALIVLEAWNGRKEREWVNYPLLFLLRGDGSMTSWKRLELNEQAIVSSLQFT